MSHPPSGPGGFAVPQYTSQASDAQTDETMMWQGIATYFDQWGPKPTSTTTEYNSASAHPQYLCTPAEQDLPSNNLYPDHDGDHNSLAPNNREHYYNEQAPLRAHDDTSCGAPSSPCRDPPAQPTDAELLNFNPTSGHDVDAWNLYLQQLIHQAMQAQEPIPQAPHSPVTVTNHTIASIRAEEIAQEYTPPQTPHPYSLLQTQAPALDYSLAQTHPHPHTTAHVHGHYRPHVTEAFPKFTQYQDPSLPSLHYPAQPHSVYATIPRHYLTQARTSSSTRSVHYQHQPSNAPDPPNTPNPVPVTDPPANTMFGGRHCEPHDQTFTFHGISSATMSQNYPSPASSSWSKSKKSQDDHIVSPNATASTSSARPGKRPAARPSFQSVLARVRPAHFDHTYICEWGSNCGKPISGSAAEVTDHLRKFHDIERNKEEFKLPATCQWRGCANPNNAVGSLAKHICAHLKSLLVSCPYCGKHAARKDSLRRHLSCCSVYQSAGGAATEFGEVGTNKRARLN